MVRGILALFALATLVGSYWSEAVKSHLYYFIIAAVVTPTPDPITQTMFAIPLYVLFEIAIFASARVEKAGPFMQR